MLYFDTSALVKAYITEDSSDFVRKLFESETTVSTSILAYTEAISAFSKANRKGRINRKDKERVTRTFKNDWSSYLNISVTANITKDAAELTAEHELRAYDAIHLSSALELQSNLRQDSLSFLSFDQNLNNSAKKEDLKIVENLD